MARNEEKQLGRLNRLYLAKQKQDELEHNPKRPSLVTLNKPEDIRKWLPYIKKDLEYYLAQTKVACYPERKIEEFSHEIDCLKREYHAYVRKLKQIDPNCDTVLLTEKAYGKRKNQDENSSGKPKITKDDNATNDIGVDNEKIIDRMTLPILESETEMVYRLETNQTREMVKQGLKMPDNESNLNYETMATIQSSGKWKHNSNKKLRNHTDNLTDTTETDNLVATSSTPIYFDTGAGSYNNQPLQFTHNKHDTDVNSQHENPYLEKNLLLKSVVDYSSSSEESS